MDEFDFDYGFDALDVFDSIEPFEVDMDTGVRIVSDEVDSTDDEEEV